MTEVNPFANPPIFRYEEVLTLADIDAIKNGYLYQWESRSWLHPIEKFKYLVAIGTCNSLFQWVHDGKPIMKRKGK